MPAFFRSTVGEFLRASPGEVLAQLTLNYARMGFTDLKSDTPIAWWIDLGRLHTALIELTNTLSAARHWPLLLEYTLPRKAERLDVVLLAGQKIIILECKSAELTAAADRQVETYALLLHYFHQGSDQREILSFVVSTRETTPSTEALNRLILQQQSLAFDAAPTFWVHPARRTSWTALPGLLRTVANVSDVPLDGATWDASNYRPTPTIIEAALALHTGLRIEDIARSEAAETDITAVTQTIYDIIAQAKENGTRSIIFLTGVPGSGKTLVGLSLAHRSEHNSDAIHFLSGNGPLVRVLQENFRRHATAKGIRAAKATIQAKTLIEDVHLFARHYTQDQPAALPSNHVVIFDEAQRAWNFEQSKRKFKREHSEPTMFLRIMERHPDWACIVALVGGGQEINNGEAGLEEWGRALTASASDWQIFASPEVIVGGPSTAGRKLFPDEAGAKRVHTNPHLHLRTSNRSLRADKLALWVNHLLEGNDAAAAELDVSSRFPILLTRSLRNAKRLVRCASLGSSRYGLIGSSKAARLRAEGLEPDGSFHRGYPWEHWYLGRSEDVRSSYACEVFATEFEIQGLELDWTCVCWGGDLVWKQGAWKTRKFWPSSVPKWISIRKQEDVQYRLNAYRVLLTRARQGLVLFVPEGDPSDPSRNPAEMDDTANFLARCGARLIGEPSPSEGPPV